MDAADLKGRLDALTTAISRACGVFDVPTDQTLDADADFLFEVVCYFALVAGLRVRRVLCVPGTLAESHCPRTGRLRFRVQLSTGEELDVCQGTEIRDVYGTPRAPDVQLQHANEDAIPPFTVLVGIWDAKYRGGRRQRISKEDFFKFVGYMETLDVPDVAAGDVLERTAPAAFRVSALLTNGIGPTEKPEHLLEKGVSIVERFAGDASLVPDPTVDAHLRSARRPGRPNRRATAAPGAGAAVVRLPRAVRTQKVDRPSLK